MTPPPFLAFSAFALVFNSFAAPQAEPTASPTSSPCAPRRVLFLTDSHGLGPWGEAMDRWFAALPETELQAYHLGGAHPGWWNRGKQKTPRGHVFRSCEGKPVPSHARLAHRSIPTPTAAELMAGSDGAYSSQTVVIALGTNLPDVVSVYRTEGSRLLKTVQGVSGARCVWIGPPNMGRRKGASLDAVYREIAGAIREAAEALGVAPCQLVDSRKHSTFPPHSRKDQVHYPFTPDGEKAAKAWADGVILELTPLTVPEKAEQPCT